MIWWVTGAAIVLLVYATAIGFTLWEIRVKRTIIRKMGLGAVMGNPPMVDEKEHGSWP